MVLLSASTMISRDIIDKYTSQVRNEISQKCANLLHEYPIDFYLSDVKSYGGSCSYKYFSPEIKTVFKQILIKYDSHVFALYQKLALSAFIENSIERLPNKDIPESIQRIYQGWFKRVLEDFSIQSDDFYHYENDAFQKDLSVCSLRLLPVGGCWVIQATGSIDRRFLLGGGSRQFFNCLKLVLFKTRGRNPFYSIHAVDRYIDKFNEFERYNCYIRIAELLKLNSNVKGFMGLSWYFDPQLEKISPRLAYLRQRPEQNGAEVFRRGTRQSDIESALKKSPTRRRLYKEGKYVPVCHGVVWPRKELIAWADKQTSKSL